jgi:hypothetical protein
MTVYDLIALLDSEQSRKVLANIWTVPVGMVVLYFYGLSHFNTPQYSLELSSGEPFRLITQTPPIFTTTRARYNNYAYRYVFILELVYLIFLFAHSVIEDAATIGKLQLPNWGDQPLHYRVVLALFVLTGLLSSFPVIKQIDAWLLENLHKSAFIPGDAKNLAEKLYNCPFIAPPDVRRSVQAVLNMRDTIRVAEGKASGVLERRVFEILCLRSLLQARRGERFAEFKIILDRDFRALTEQSQNIRSAVVSYLRAQERMVPETASDIDLYISEKAGAEGMLELSERRQELQARCDGVYESLCLVVALSVFATEFDPEDIDSAIGEMGFSTTVDRLPPSDWNTIGLIGASTFVLMLAFNGLYVLFGHLSGLFDKYPIMMPSRVDIIRYAVIYTFAYAIVIWLSIAFKRRWRRIDDGELRPEDLLLAVFGYFATVWLNVIFSLILRGGQLTYAPFLYALNQAILGFFIGLYIDRSMKCPAVSVGLAFIQAAAQATGAVIATTLSPSVFSPTFDLLDLQIAAFASLQAAFSGFIISILFQRLYGRTRSAGLQLAPKLQATYQTIPAGSG